MSERSGFLAEDFCRSVYDMMVGFGQTEEVDWKDHNTKDAKEPDLATVRLRQDLIREEFEEYLQASSQGDLVEVADALGDMMVVIAGAAVAYRIDLPAVLEEIQRSNLAKIDPETGRVHKRDDGKVLKPEGWQPPNIEAVM